MDAGKRIMAIYDMAYSSKCWTIGLDALLHGTEAKHLLVYDAGDRRSIEYSNQSGDTGISSRPTALSDYNAMIRDRGDSSLDATGSKIVHSKPCFLPILDEDVWSIDKEHRNRPEIQFTIQRMDVYRRFFINLTEDPQSYVGLIALYQKDRIEAPPVFDRSLLASFSPHLGKAMEIYRALYALRLQYNAVLSVLNKLAIPVCIVDHDSHVVLKNRRAELLLTDKLGLWTDKAGKLRCDQEDDHRALTDAVSRTNLTSVGNGHDRSIELTIRRRGQSVPLCVIASPLRDADMELEPGLTGSFLTIIDDSQRNFGDFGMVARAYELTPAEARLLPLIVHGMTTPECSERLNVGSETVKSQAASILRKTNCRNRVSLVWRVFSFAPPIL